jgi:hypothetical protein
MGATREARCAGRKPASAATAVINKVDAAIVSVSVALTPNSRLEAYRVVASVAGTPIRDPAYNPQASKASVLQPTSEQSARPPTKLE